MDKPIKQETVAGSMIWKTLERYCALAAQLIVQIVIARILEPEAFGLISMMMVFISVATVFIQNGFNMALVQKKEATEQDYSTALIINILIGLTLYAIMFLCAPLIADYYEQETLTRTLRVLALILIIGSVSSIQIAIATRNMQFRIIFVCNLLSSVLSGAVGIIFALSGFGVWALIIQQLSSQAILVVGYAWWLKWKPSFSFNVKSAKAMFSFGWKLLVAGTINQIYNELNDLVIGKKYTSTQLAYYSKGKQIPVYLTTGIDSSIQSVLFSAFSKQQSELVQLRGMLRKSIAVNTYIVFPMMMGLAVVAEPLTVLLLTEKWLSIVPYMRICCFTYALHPIVTAHLQALAAIGRSDVRLKLEYIKKPIGILLLIGALLLNKGPIMIAYSAALTSLITFCIDMMASQVLVKVSLREQFLDVLPLLLMTAIMGIAIYFFQYLPLPSIGLLAIQILVGVVIYFVMSAILKPAGYTYVMGFVKKSFSIRKVH